MPSIYSVTRDRSWVNWEEFVLCHVRANETYSLAKHQLVTGKTFKSAVFGSSSSLPPLVSEGGGLVCESVGIADLLSDHFDSKQSREALDLPLLVIHLPVLPSLRSGRVR